MKAQVTEERIVSVSPQIHSKASTARIMWSVSLCLLPASAWGVYVFGIRALLVLAVSIASSVVTEYFAARLLGKTTLNDGSAFLTGLLIGMNLPSAVPLYIPIVASFFAMAVVKWSFGGLGANWMNPALAGRVFVFFSWTGHMTNWTAPRTLPAADALSSATVLSSIKSGLFGYTGSAEGPVQFLAEQGYPTSALDGRVASFLSRLGIENGGGYGDLFFGNIPGCIGEVSALLLLLGAIYLFASKIVTWHIPVAYIGSFSLLVWFLGGLPFDAGLFAGNVVFNLFSGGLLLGAFFMATDMVTSPLTAKGMIIYGVGAGFLTYLIRFFGSFPEGVSLAILLMNIFVPLIDRYTGPMRFGMKKKGADE